MPGRSPAEAVQNFVQPLQRAFSCVVRSVVDVGGGYWPGVEHRLVLGNARVQPLRGVPLTIWAGQKYRIAEVTGARDPWTVVTTGYSYHVDTSQGQPVLRYDWHPFSPGDIDFPHLHLGAALNVSMPQVQSAHLPTGLVSADQFIRLLLTDLGAEPLRTDWPVVLAETKTAIDG